MPHAVSHPSTTFCEAVAEAVVIVLIVSLVSLGVRTGMVVVISIPLVLAVTRAVHVSASISACTRSRSAR